MKPGNERNRFRMQAAIGLLSVVALSAFALVAAVVVERDATADSRRIIDEYRREVGAARQLELRAEQLVAAARGYLLTGDDSFRDSLTDARREFDDSVRMVEQELRSPGHEHFLLRIRDATAGYRSALERLSVGRASTLDLPSLSRVFEQLLVPRRRALRQAVREFVEDRERRLADGQQSVHGRVARAERRVIGIGVLSPALALLLAIVVWRRLGQLYTRQEQATRRAETAIARRDELLGVVAHDLRTPLNAIALRASLMCEDTPNAARRESGQAIQRTVQRMDGLIRGLLDSAAIESGQLQLFRESCKVGDLVASVVETFEPLAVQKGIRFAVQCDEADLVIHADRERMNQVLSNLVSNAVKFARPGDRVELRVQETNRSVQFDVCDTGPGIPDDVRPRLFDRYHRGPRGGGVGLGLYIARAIVDAHRGSIDFASEEGKGSIFRVRVPLVPPTPARTPADSGGPPAVPPPDACHDTSAAGPSRVARSD